MSFFAPDPPVVYRPLSLSILGWYLFIGGLGAFFPILLVFPDSPALTVWQNLGIDPQVLVGLSVVSGIVHGAAGLAILKRIPWGRTLYLVFTPLQLVATSVLLGLLTFSGLAAGALTYGFVFFLLTRQEARDYFEGTVVEEPPRVAALRAYRREQGSRSDLARVLGIVVGVVSTYLVFLLPIIVGTIMNVGGTGLMRSVAMGVGGSLLGITALSLSVGAMLWGIRRSKAYLGWVFLVAGLWLLIGSLSVSGMMDQSFWELFPDLEPDNAEEISRTLGDLVLWMKIGGLALSSVGAPLVWFQRVADLAAIEEE